MDQAGQAQADQQNKFTETRFKALIEKSSDIIVLTDSSAKVTYASPSSLKRVLGYDAEDFQNRDGFEYVHPADLNYVMEEFQKVALVAGGSNLIEARVKHKNGTWRWVEAVCTNMLNDPEVKSVVVNVRDVTERKIAEEKAQYQFYHDSLTDLPNRNYFTEKLHTFLEDRQEKILGVLAIDLDRFKYINESLGHSIGDRMLQEVGLRLANCLDEKDVLSRLGGDEYAIILPNILREEEIGQICYKILEAIKPAFILDQHELYITPSIGIAMYPHDGADASSLMKNMDSALYRAKELGRNNFQYYNPSMNATTFQQLAMENTLRKALENDELLVYYQPQIDLRTGKITQVEALVRWMHPDLGLTFPDEFIPIAETTGLVQPIGEFVLKTACAEVKEWERRGLKVNLAINVSGQQLRESSLIKAIREVLEELDFDPCCLELEFTERVLLDDSDTTYNTLIQLKKDGIKFAIDDFNTGYSSMSYLKRLPIDILKIDKSFVRGIPHIEQDNAIANTIINLTHSLGMEVVAEGVERPAQLEFLKERNCDKFQGYLISPPVSAEEMLKILEKEKFQQ